MADTDEICHYLEVAPEEVLTSPTGWCNCSPTYCDLTEISSSPLDNTFGYGKKNTEIIVNYHLVDDSTNNAAIACDEYSNNGYSDWFLPSIGELDKLWQSGVVITENNWHWSSTQDTADSITGNTDQAWVRSFSGATASLRNNYNKENKLYVRAIRAF